jgi:hypothetical protein
MNLNKNNYTMEFYTNNPTNLHTPIKKGKLTKKQKIQEIISNLETCIEREKSKLGGGNKELIIKLENKLNQKLKPTPKS